MKSSPGRTRGKLIFILGWGTKNLFSLFVTDRGSIWKYRIPSWSRGKRRYERYMKEVYISVTL